jgi:hypothetical protein
MGDLSTMTGRSLDIQDKALWMTAITAIYEFVGPLPSAGIKLGRSWTAPANPPEMSLEAKILKVGDREHCCTLFDKENPISRLRRFYLLGGGTPGNLPDTPKGAQSSQILPAASDDLSLDLFKPSFCLGMVASGPESEQIFNLQNDYANPYLYRVAF